MSVCSPVHNEAANLPDLVRRVHDAMAPTGWTWEQVLVDDCSTDGSASVIEALRRDHPEVVLVRHPINMRERAAWKTAFANARGEVVVMLAADLQSRPEYIPALVRIVLDGGYDVGTAARRNRQDRPVLSFATACLSLACRVLFGLAVRDVSSSFFAVRTRFVRGLRFVENDHRYILPIFHRNGAAIQEIEAEHSPRVAGASHYSDAKILRAAPEFARFCWRYFRGEYDLKGEAA